MSSRRLLHWALGLTIAMLLLAGCGEVADEPSTTSTPVSQVATSTPVSPTATSTPVPPTATSTPVPPTATPTPQPIGDAEAAYFRQMFLLLNPLSEETPQKMLELRPPAEVANLHLNLADAADAFISQWDTILSVQDPDLRQMLLETAYDEYEKTVDQVRLGWEEYLSRYGMGLPVRYWGIAFTTPDDGWIIGDEGTILHYDGQDWQPYVSPTDENLVRIYMVNEEVGWIEGMEGALLQYADGTWQEIEKPSSQPDIMDFSILGQNDVWMLATDTESENPITEILRWNGSSWSEVLNRPGEKLPIELQMLDDQTGWVEYRNASWCLLLANGTWEVLDLPLEPDEVGALQFLDADSGWVAGTRGRIFYYDGSQWTGFDTPVDWSLEDIHMLSEDDGWAAGAVGTILHYDGSSWTEVPSPTKRDLEIRMYAQDLGWARGDLGNVLRYDGSSWLDEELPLEQGFFEWPALPSPNDAWAIAELSGILHFDGSSWEVVYQWPDVVE
jgi:photosystem II stability/assembly factor-like uncharacterized protein